MAFDPPVAFTLPNCGNERYYLSVEVAHYLSCVSLFKRFPAAWKRPLTPFEKIYLVDNSLCAQKPNCFIVRAAEMDQYIEERRNFSIRTPEASKSFTRAGSSTTEMEKEMMPAGKSSSIIYDGTQTANTFRSGSKCVNLLKTPKLITTITLRRPMDTYAEKKPKAFTCEAAEGSTSELYYKAHDLNAYITAGFCVGNYALLWRKRLPNETALQAGILPSKRTNVTTIVRVRDIDEIIAGRGQQFLFPLPVNGELPSYTLGDGERYYIASFIGHAVGFPKLFQNYFNRLWKRRVVAEDQTCLWNQGVYGVRVHSFIYKKSEVDEIFAGKGAKYHVPRRRTNNLQSHKMLKRAKLKFKTTKSRPPPAQILLDVDRHEKYEEDEEMIDETEWKINENTNENGSLSDVLTTPPFDFYRHKNETMQALFRMSVSLPLPLTIIENDAFRTMCQHLLNIGCEFGKSSKGKILDINSVLPTYFEARAYIDNVMAPQRDALLKTAREAAACGGISASVLHSTMANAHDFAVVTLHFITKDWKLKTLPMAPIEVNPAGTNDNSVHIRDEVLKSLFNGIENENINNGEANNENNFLNEIIDDKSLVNNNGNGDEPSTNLNSIKANIHFVLHHLFGEYFCDLSQHISYSTSVSVTRCFGRLLDFLKSKVAHKQERMNLTDTQINYINRILFDSITNSCNQLKRRDSPTINRVLPVVREWTRHFEYIAGEEQGELAKMFAEELLAECRTTRERHFNKDIFYYAIILDPSQKNKIREHLPDKQKRNELTDRFKADVINLRNLYSSASNKIVKKVVDSFFDDEDLVKDDNVDTEIMSYLCTPSVEFSDNTTSPAANISAANDAVSFGSKIEQAQIYTDVLDYWHRNDSKFPNCALLARNVLAVPAGVEQDFYFQATASQSKHHIDTETLLWEAQPKTIADLDVLLSMRLSNF